MNRRRGEALPTLERSVLDRLRRENPDDPELVGELLRLFREHIPPLLDELARTLEVGATPDAFRIAHRVGGSARAIGVAALADACGAVEAAAGAGDLPRARELAGPLPRLAAAALEALAVYPGRR